MMTDLNFGVKYPFKSRITILILIIDLTMISIFIFSQNQMLFDDFL